MNFVCDVTQVHLHLTSHSSGYKDDMLPTTDVAMGM